MEVGETLVLTPGWFRKPIAGRIRKLKVVEPGQALFVPGRFYTVKEVAEVFRFKPRTICTWIREGQLEAEPTGKEYRILGRKAEECRIKMREKRRH